LYRCGIYEFIADIEMFNDDKMLMPNKTNLGTIQNSISIVKSNAFHILEL